MSRKRNKELTLDQKKAISKALDLALKESSYKSQRELAEATGIAKSSLNRMFKGDESDNSFTLPNMIALSEALDVKIDFLLGGEYKNRDLSYEDISNKTGLSEESIEYMASIKEKKSLISAINFLLSSEEGQQVIEYLAKFLFIYPKSAVREGISLTLDLTDISIYKDVDMSFDANTCADTFLFDILELLRKLRRNTAKELLKS